MVQLVHIESCTVYTVRRSDRELQSSRLSEVFSDFSGAGKFRPTFTRTKRRRDPASGFASLSISVAMHLLAYGIIRYSHLIDHDLSIGFTRFYHEITTFQSVLCWGCHKDVAARIINPFRPLLL